MSSSLLANLRARPVASSIWDQLPYTRRAGVLVILFSDKYGQISPILTLRSQSLSSFSGDAALPGGKADDGQESAYQVARREADEEIGFSRDDKLLSKAGIKVDFLTSLPAYLSRNLLAVKPSILHISGSGLQLDPQTGIPSIINHSTNEVKEVFSVPLERFLSNREGWYSSKPVSWGGLSWNQHHFRTIRSNKIIGETGWTNVWGLTANILVDIARVAFDREPPMAHRSQGVVGDEKLLEELFSRGILTEKIDKKKDLRVNFSKIFGKNSELLNLRK